MNVSDAPPATHAERLARYATISTSLSLLSDRRLGDLVEAAPLLAAGIGGTSTVVEIDETAVFVKRIPLTDLERRPENVRSTANMFDLPTFYQYNLGSVGFGAWRELAANAMTTNWVLDQQCASFPLMYGWRVLTGSTPSPDEHSDLGRTVAYWHDSRAVRSRLEALAQSSASVVLFLEYVPQNLNEYLTAKLAEGDHPIEAAARMVERHLLAGVTFMNTNQLAHFDAHFRNVLTDGQRLYFADLGLATSLRFELSADEASFLAANASHDRCYVVAEFVNWFVSRLATSASAAERNETVRRCARGEILADVPPVIAEIVGRYAPIAAVMNDFYWQLHGTSRATPYPGDEIRRVGAEIGFSLG